MRLTEIEHQFFHGSMEHLPEGTVLTPRDNYQTNWGGTSFYGVLEKHRPPRYLAHHQAVFMVGNEDDVDLAGGGTEWLFTVQPIARVERHDLNWSSEISMLVDQGYDADSDKVKTAAKNYWEGVPHYNESVWEYLTPRAKIIAVERY
jgi:hypothetical protein